MTESKKKKNFLPYLKNFKDYGRIKEFFPLEKNNDGFINFNLLEEIRKNWWFLLKVLGNLYMQPFNPKIISHSWANIVNSKELNFTCFLYDEILVREFVTNDKAKKVYDKTYSIKLFDYTRFNEYYRFNPGQLLQNLREKIVGKIIDKQSNFHFEFAGSFAQMLEYLLTPSDLENSLSNKFTNNFSNKHLSALKGKIYL